MTFTAHGPRILGNAGTIFYRDEAGNVIPVVSVIQDRPGVFNQEMTNRIVENLVSALNGQEPAHKMQMHGVRIGWERTHAGLDITVANSHRLGDKTRLHLILNPACPDNICETLYNRLAEEGGMTEVLKQVTMTPAPAPTRNPGFRPAA